MSFMLISRDFWPSAASIGNGLMELARYMSLDGKVFIVTMSAVEIKAKAKDKKINFLAIKPLTNSESNIFLRIFEILYFALWVIFSLLRKRPNKVYIATNPPIFIPLIVSTYSLLFRKRFIYHVQDIHPEATSLVFNLPRFLEYILKKIDTWVLNEAHTIITITKDMKNTLLSRGCETEIHLLENPSDESRYEIKKTKGIVFAGNAGRLQNMDLVISAIDKYLSENGSLPFVFVGGGVYSSQLSKLAANHKSFEHVGRVNIQKALKIMRRFEWALLPIKGEVLDYAFPSKLPGYLAASCKIICCTNMKSNLVKWIDRNDLGFSCSENVNSLVSAFKHIETLDVVKQNSPNLFITPKQFGKSISDICKI